MVQVNRFKQVLLPVINFPAHTGQWMIPPKLSLIGSEERQNLSSHRSVSHVLWWWVQGESQREIRSGSVTVCDRNWEQGSQANSMVVGMATLASSVWVWHTVSSGVLPKLESFFLLQNPSFFTIPLLQLYRETLLRERARVTPPSFTHISYTVPHHRANLPLKLFCYL